MKNWPSRARWGPTGWPPLSRSRLVAPKMARPKRSPATTPEASALTRRTRKRIVRSISRAWSATSDLVEELPQRVTVHAALEQRGHQQLDQIAEAGEGPARQPAEDGAVAQADQAPTKAHGVTGKEL